MGRLVRIRGLDDFMEVVTMIKQGRTGTEEPSPCHTQGRRDFPKTDDKTSEDSSRPADSRSRAFGLGRWVAMWSEISR